MKVNIVKEDNRNVEVNIDKEDISEIDNVGDKKISMDQ